MMKLAVSALALALTACAATLGAPPPKLETVCMPCGNPCEFPCPPGGFPKAATPTFTPAQGTFTEGQTVAIASATEGAKIHYTTDGSEPTKDSPVYSGPVTVGKNATLKAIAVAPRMSASDVGSGAYVIAPPPCRPRPSRWRSPPPPWRSRRPRRRPRA